MTGITEHTVTLRPPLSDKLLEELKSIIQGPVYARGDEKFKAYTMMFNGNVVTVASAVALPIDASDISHIVSFCNANGLSPSIKAGGYGTAGWAINGDIVVDLRKLNCIEMETPGDDGSFVSIRDMPMPHSKGKEKVRGRTHSLTIVADSGTPRPTAGSPAPSGGGKRRRSPDIDPIGRETELPRNSLIARFLSGPGAQVTDVPTPSVRRRVDSVFSKDTPRPTDDTHASEGALQNSMGPGKNPAELTQISQEGRSCAPQEGHSSQPSVSAVTKNNIGEHEASTEPENTQPNEITSPPNRVTTSQMEQLSMITGTVIQNDVLSSSQTISNSLGGSNTSQIQPASTPSRGKSNLRSEDPFSYLSSGPSQHRSERDYVQQPIYRPPPQFTLPMGLYSTAPPSTSADTWGPGHLMMGPSEIETSPWHAFPRYMSSTSVPQYSCAYVTFGAGAKQKDIDLFSASNELPANNPNGMPCSVAYHVPFAAHPVGSSVMMLGGFGFLSRLHGLSIDALVEVEMVLADGSIVIVSETEHPDLWWALRGAGPAFGITTRYKAKAYPVPIVFAGNLIYNFDPATAASLIKHFRDCIKNAPRELYANVLFTAGPADKGSLVVIQMCYIGAREKGQEFLQALSSWDGGPCLLNEVSEKSFLHQQDSVAQILRGKAGRQWFIRSALITSLPDEIIHKTVFEFANTPVGCTWLVELAGGAVADEGNTCLPKSQREAAFTIVALHQWELDDDDPLCISTAEHWICETLKPVATGGPYPAFFGRNEDPQRVIASFGENWARLCEVKNKYDPKGIFSNCFWPLNKEGDIVSASSHEPPSPVGT